MVTTVIFASFDLGDRIVTTVIFTRLGSGHKMVTIHQFFLGLIWGIGG